MAHSLPRQSLTDLLMDKIDGVYESIAKINVRYEIKTEKILQAETR